MNWRVNEKKQRERDGESEQEKLVEMRKSRREYMEEIVILAAYLGCLVSSLGHCAGLLR